jgi:CubicO group peptidase (beta-lactamase class C family)
MRRREFLTDGGRAAVALSVLSLAGCSRGNQPATASATEARWKPLVAELEVQIPAWMADAAVPGLSIAVIQESETVWQRGFGVRDATSPETVDDATVFEAQSMSKPVFAYAVMKLYEKGVIELDAPLTRYTSERLLTDDPRLDSITARRVLSHTSGLPNWRSNDDPLRINFTPGERYLYSGEGYSYLQSVVTHLEGHVNLNDCASFEMDLEVCATDIDAYMKANVLAPLEMRTSGYLWNDAFERHAARRHDGDGKPMKWSRPTAPAVARYAAAGELRTTPADYAKFMISLLEPREGDPFRLSRRTVGEMLQAQVKVDDSVSWSLGWAIQHTPRGDFIFHGGGIDGAHCKAVASVAHKTGYVVMTNGQNGYRLIEKLDMSDAIGRLL